jgi:hypothetical protein
MLTLRSFLKSPLGKRVSKVITAIAAFVYFMIFGMLIVLIIATGFDRRLLINNEYINMVSLYAIILSAPGIWVNFVEDVLQLEKRRYRGKVTCAECQHTIEIEFEEILD